jgi:hypothetical protein
MVYDPYEELAGSIESLKEDMQNIFSSAEPKPLGLFTVDRHDILRVLAKNIEELRKEIVELTGAIWELVNNE